MTTLQKLMQQMDLQSSPEIQQLLMLKATYNQLEKQIAINQSLVDDSLANVNKVLSQCKKKSINFLHNTYQQLDKVLIELEQARNGAGIQFQYICGCNFKTNCPQKYKSHLISKHKIWELVKGSTHFVSPLGVIYKFDLQKFTQKKDKKDCNTHQIQRVLNFSNTKKIKQRVKSAPKSKTVINIQNKKAEVIKPKQITEQNQNTKNYFCGQCHSRFEQFSKYCQHIRRHDYIIHPESSHVIVRNKGKNSEAIEVKNADKSKQRYSCPCNAGLNFSKLEYINHIFKWHKGIAPRK